MPNGKPGDHPVTDICVHRIRTYTEEIDDLIRELVKHGHGDAIERELFAFSALPDENELKSLVARLRSIESGT